MGRVVHKRYASQMRSLDARCAKSVLLYRGILDKLGHWREAGYRGWNIREIKQFFALSILPFLIALDFDSAQNCLSKDAKTNHFLILKGFEIARKMIANNFP